MEVKREVLREHIVSEAGTQLDLQKIKVIQELKPPTDVKDIQRAIGHIGWYSYWIDNYTIHVMPLTNLYKKDVKFEWTAACKEGFDVLKDKLISYQVLKPPNWKFPFHVYCDRSTIAVGNILCQQSEDGNKDHFFRQQAIVCSKA